MHRIDTPTADPDAYGAGKDGFTEGDPLTATPPTGLSADWFGAVQEELAGVVEGTGVTLAKADNGQLLAAIRTLMVGTIAAANWVLREAAGSITAGLTGIASDGEGTLVMVGDSGTIQVSNDGGITWAASTADGSYTGTFDAVAYGNGLFVAAGAGPEIQTSPDGVTWTQQTEGGTGGSTPFGITFGADLFVSVWGTGGVIRTSPDGVTWTQQTGASATTAGAGFGDDIFITVGGSGEIQTSPDGETWTARTADNSYADTLRAHAYGNGLHVIVGNAGEIQTSPDGETWTHRSSGATNNLRSIVFGGGVFVVVGEDSNAVLISFDGISWTKTFAPAPATGDLRGVCFDGQGFAAVGDSAAIVTSLRAVGV